MSKKIFISIIVLLFVITIFCQRVEAMTTDPYTPYNDQYERFYGKQDSLQISKLIGRYISCIESHIKENISSNQYYAADYYYSNIIPILIIDDEIYIAWEEDLEKYANDLNSIKQQIESSEDEYFVEFYYNSQYIGIIEIHKNLESNNETKKYPTIQESNKLDIIFNRIVKIIGDDINAGQMEYLLSIKPSEVKYEIKSNSILDKIEQDSTEHYKVTYKYDSNGKVEMIEFSRDYSMKVLIIVIALIIVLIIVCIILFKYIKKHIKK